MIKENLKRISDSVTEHYKNFEVMRCNAYSLRMSVNNGIYDWHLHTNSDELFIVLEGTLYIDIDDEKTFTLKPLDFVKIPKGVLHRTRSTHRTVNLTFESKETETVFVNFDSSKVTKDIDFNFESLVVLADNIKGNVAPLCVIHDHEVCLWTLDDRQKKFSKHESLIFIVGGSGKLITKYMDCSFSSGELILLPPGTGYELDVFNRAIFVAFEIRT